MIAFIFDLGIRLATFVASAAAFFRESGAGLRGRKRPLGSAVAFPCQFPAEPRGRGNVFPARHAGDLAQAIDYIRNYRQNRADFDAEIKILPDLRERGPAPLALHAAASEMPSASRSGATRLVNTPLVGGQANPELGAVNVDEVVGDQPAIAFERPGPVDVGRRVPLIDLGLLVEPPHVGVLAIVICRKYGVFRVDLVSAFPPGASVAEVMHDTRGLGKTIGDRYG